jgi:hypothetical protein
MVEAADAPGGLTPEKATEILANRMKAIRQVVDPAKASSEAAKLEKSQNVWDGVSFYSMIGVGLIGTVMSGIEIGTIGVGVTAGCTAIGAAIEKAAQNPNRRERLSKCERVEKTGFLLLNEFEARWELAFAKQTPGKPLPPKVVDAFDEDRKVFEKDLAELIGLCRFTSSSGN